MISFDERNIIEINRRYQELFFSDDYQSFLRKKRVIDTIRSLDIKQIYGMLSDRRLNRLLIGTEGNISYEKEDGLRFEHTESCRIAVYSCIVGQYDNIKEPIVKEENVDYYMFTDQNIEKDSVWKKVDISIMEEFRGKSPFMINRIIKMHPDIYLPSYDWTMYIDGTIQIVGGVRSTIAEMGKCFLGLHFHNERDCIYNEGLAVINQKKASCKVISKQLNDYKDIGFPPHYGLYENTIIVRKKDNCINLLMSNWLEEYEKYPSRDQISLPFVIWRYNFDRSLIHILGENINKNPRFIRHLSHRG